MSLLKRSAPALRSIGLRCEKTCLRPAHDFRFIRDHVGPDDLWWSDAGYRRPGPRHRSPRSDEPRGGRDFVMATKVSTPSKPAAAAKAPTKSKAVKAADQRSQQA